MEYVRSLSMGHKFQASSLGAPLVEAQFEEGMFIKDPRAVNNIPDAYWDNHFIARQQRVYSVSFLFQTLQIGIGYCIL